MYYQKQRKKEIIKNVIYIFFILLLAVVSTYYIYNKFQDDRNIPANSKSLDITYHESTGTKVSITKITPVTDSVGLSSKAYQITLKNNLTEKVNYKIKVIDDLEKQTEDNCSDIAIPKDNIKISVKTNKMSNKIYYLTDLEDGILLEDEMDALEKKDVSIRVWIRQDSQLLRGSKMHYHSIIKVIEEEK